MTKRKESICRTETQEYKKSKIQIASDQYTIIHETVKRIEGIKTPSDLEKTDPWISEMYKNAFKALIDAQLATKSSYKRSLDGSIYSYTDIHAVENIIEETSSDYTVYKTDWLSTSIFDDLYAKDFVCGCFFSKDNSEYAARSLQAAVNNALKNMTGKESRTIRTSPADEPQEGDDGSTFKKNEIDEKTNIESDCFTFDFIKHILEGYHDKSKWKKLVVIANWFVSILVNDPTVDNAYLRDRIETIGYKAVFSSIVKNMAEIFNLNLDYLNDTDFRFITTDKGEKTDKETLTTHSLESLIYTELKFIRKEALAYFYG